MNHQQYLIKEDAKIKEALKKIDSVKPKILFVAKEEILVGSLTDGDIRRYLMAGGSVEDPVVQACNRKPKKVAHSLEEAAGMLDGNYIAIPVIDRKKKILDIYTGKRQSVRRKKLNVPVVINAGGKGTRLDPFTKILPKPLIPVGDLPIIEHIMRRYEEYGCDRFDIIVNYKKELIKSYFKEIDREYPITWTDEKEPLGTGGGLSLMKNKLKDTFFFVCCDSLILTDYSEILKFHRKNQNDITMICSEKHITIPYGIVHKDDNNVLETIEEKPEYTFLTNTAMYLVEGKILEDIEQKKADFPDIIRMEQEKGRKIGVYAVDEEDWLDMGQMSELEKMRVRLYGE